MSTVSAVSRPRQVEPIARPISTRPGYVAPRWPTALPGGRRLRPFNLVAAMTRRGITIEMACDTFAMAEWLIRKCRIANLATDDMVARLSDPAFHIITITGAGGLAGEYRVYLKRDNCGGRFARLWRPDAPGYTVAESAIGVTCTCPDATRRHADDIHYRCKHARALIAAKMLSDVAVTLPAPGDPIVYGGQPWSTVAEYRETSLAPSYDHSRALIHYVIDDRGHTAAVVADCTADRATWQVVG